MKEENIYYVYLHIKEDTGEPFYVGRGKSYRYNSKYRRSRFWNNIVNKHGYDIIFLEKNISYEESNKIEIYWINRIGRRDLGLGPLVNLTNGGEGTLGVKLTEDHKKKISEKVCGDKNGFYGKKHSDESIEKIINANLGNKNMLGKKHSDESRKKMSESKLGKKMSVSQLKKHIEDRKKPRNLEPILQFDLDGNFIKEWMCAFYISKELNIRTSHILNTCRGIHKKMNGFIFKFKNNNTI